MVRIEPIEKLERIVIDRDGMTRLDGDRLRAVDDAWLELCDINPRYFNGSILAFEGYDPQSGVIRARVEQFKHHAVRDSIDLGVSLLAVTAVLAADDESGTERYLLGRRSGELHQYNGLWELGPSGGVDAPDDGDGLDRAAILSEAAREVREESGLETGARPTTPIALVHDKGAGSTDIAIRIELAGVPKIEPNWEYSATRWVTQDEFVQWIRRSPDELIPTTVELARLMFGAG